MNWRISLFAIGGAALLGAGVAWTQTGMQQEPAPRGPAPTEIPLVPDRAEAAALAQARRDPLAARLQGVLRQTPESAAVLAQIQTSAVPVLGPPDALLLRTARYYPGDRQYTLVVRRPGQIIEIFGATKALQPPPGANAPPSPPEQPAAPQVLNRVVAPSGAAAARAQAAQRGLTDIVAEQTEYGVDVAFSRFGAAYNLTFICDAMGPPDCTEAAAVAYAASLELLGGGDQ